MLTLAEALALKPGDPIVAGNGSVYLVQSVSPRKGDAGVVLALKRADDGYASFATEYDLCVLSRPGSPAPVEPPVPEVPPAETPAPEAPVEPVARKGKKAEEPKG